MTTNDNNASVTNTTQFAINADGTVTLDKTGDPRDIDVLMHMDTYQGMTDEEINLVIEKHKELSYNEGETSVKQDLYAEMENKLVAATQEASDKAQAAFEKACALQCNFATVIDNVEVIDNGEEGQNEQS